VKKVNFPLAPLIFVILTLVLSGCQFLGIPLETLESTSTETATKIPTLTPKPTLTHTPTPTIPPTDTPTPTAEPVEFEILATNLEQSGDWNLTLPYTDLNAPKIITATLDGYRLDPAFEVDSIELSYEWWGLGDPVLDYQRIEKRGSQYWRGNTAIPLDSIKAVVESVSNLHPEPQMLNNITHTDDYPIWAIELSSGDGAHVLLFSSSNDLNFAPWNVIYNGQIYSQFDGQIATTLSPLFEVTAGQPMASTGTGNWEEGYLVVDTTGWPGQLSSGFNGLLAVQSNFNYWPDAQKYEIHGYFRGRSSIGGMGNMIIGSITDLQAIKIELVKDRWVSCTLDKLTSEDPAAYSWEFVCPADEATVDPGYQFPIQVTFRTDQDQTYTSKGELFGYWEQGTALPAIAYPEEIKTILDNDPVVQDLLSDHQLVVLSFNASADPASGSIDHRWIADLALFGQAKLDERVLPYSVTIKVGIYNGKLITWDLNRAKLEALLQEVLKQPITQRFLEADPNLILNLYYGESPNYQILDKMDLPPCADLPAPKGLPNLTQALLGFGFNQSLAFSGLQIMIIDGELRLRTFNINPSAPEDALWAALLPVELQPVGAAPFTEISLWSYHPIVAISWDPNASETEIEAYKALAQTWPGNKQIESWGVMIDPGMIGITEDGKLELIDCNAP
jgi:hypothetical protein